ALGYHGPHPRAEQVLHAQFSRDLYDHGDYFPPSDLSQPTGKQNKPEAFISETLLGLPHAWPSAQPAHPRAPPPAAYPTRPRAVTPAPRGAILPPTPTAGP